MLAWRAYNTSFASSSPSSSPLGRSQTSSRSTSRDIVEEYTVSGDFDGTDSSSLFAGRNSEDTIASWNSETPTLVERTTTRTTPLRVVVARMGSTAERRVSYGIGGAGNLRK